MLSLASVSAIGDGASPKAAVAGERITITFQILQALQKQLFHFSHFLSALFFRDLRIFDPVITFKQQNQQPPNLFAFNSRIYFLLPCLGVSDWLRCPRFAVPV